MLYENSVQYFITLGRGSQIIEWSKIEFISSRHFVMYNSVLLLVCIFVFKFVLIAGFIYCWVYMMIFRRLSACWIMRWYLRQNPDEEMKHPARQFSYLGKCFVMHCILQLVIGNLFLFALKFLLWPMSNLWDVLTRLKLTSDGHYE